MKCTRCNQEVNVVWEIGNNKALCFGCLLPHEQMSLIKDSRRNDSFGQSTHKALELAGYYKDSTMRG